MVTTALSEVFEEKPIPAAFRLTRAQDKAMDVLVSDAENIALGGGSRSGKTFLLVRAVLIRAIRAPNSRHAIFRFRFNAIKASIIYDTLPKVMKLCFPGLWEQCELNKTDWFLKLPNGSEIWFGGLDDKERTEKILGQEFVTLYFNECSQIPYQSVVMAMTRLAQKIPELKAKAYYDFNPPAKSHWTYRIFVEKQDPDNKRPLKNPMDYGFYLINPMDNKDNLDAKYLARLDALPEKARKRFLLGQFADASEGQLWTEDVLAVNRRLGRAEENLPDWQRIVIAVDPSGCKGEEDYRSDEVGIVVIALGTDGHAYLLEDLSGRYGPEGWGHIVNDAFERHGADCVIGEKNFGGDMVRAVIHAAAMSEEYKIPYREVTATRGKVVRAEPISQLYNMGKVHHIGYFPEIEDQLCSFTVSGYEGLRSPDRADAVIWGLTELFPKVIRQAKNHSHSQQPTPRVITQSRTSRRLDTKRRRR